MLTASQKKAPEGSRPAANNHPVFWGTARDVRYHGLPFGPNRSFFINGFQTMPTVINFYSVNDDFGWMSNFAAFPLTIDGRVWPTSEHYFQAQKFADKAVQERIRGTSSPMQAARIGRDRKLTLRRDWESVKVSVMRQALLAKFTQHVELKELLLATGDAKLVEQTENDSYWGDGGDGTGKNMLGILLMELRTSLLSAGEP